MTTHTYPAVLRDGRIEWTGDPPAGLPDGTPVQVRITVSEPPGDADSQRGRRMAAIFQQIADRGTAFVDIADPVAWQREVRRDRPLPGRE